MISEKDLEYLFKYNACNVGKLIKHLSKAFEEWANQKLNENSFGDFKMTYMHIIMNIGPDGVTNNELSKKANVSKQAMNKVVHELVQKKYIKTTKHDKDGRSITLQLTDKGKKLVIESRKMVEGLMDQHRKEIGKKRYDAALDVMQEIIHYHQKENNQPG